jgi:hypothetical protein
MGWLRAQRRQWTWVALFALVLQLGLSFGHVHGLSGQEPAAITTTTTAAADGAAPVKHQDGGDSDNDYCAICAVTAMLSGAQVASAPILALPVVLVSVEQPVSSDEIVDEPARASFRSRAPPQA